MDARVGARSLDVERLSPLRWGNPQSAATNRHPQPHVAWHSVSSTVPSSCQQLPATKSLAIRFVKQPYPCQLNNGRPAVAPSSEAGARDPSDGTKSRLSSRFPRCCSPTLPSRLSSSPPSRLILAGAALLRQQQGRALSGELGARPQSLRVMPMPGRPVMSCHARRCSGGRSSCPYTPSRLFHSR